MQRKRRKPARKEKREKKVARQIDAHEAMISNIVKTVASSPL